jgi:Fe2+ or Zn2+ uptake regulation protein
MVADLHAEITTRLAAVEQRYTANRRSIVDVLEAATRPLTIQEILSRRSALAQSSVYRNLGVLEDAGVVDRIASSDEFARYELAEDVTGHHQHHLICRSCGTVAYFTLMAEIESTVAEALDGSATVHGFAPEHHRLDVVGRCRRCS